MADLERHCKAMTFPFPTGPDMYGQMGNEIDPRQVRHHPFTDGAHEVINDVRERLHEDEGVARDLSDTEDLRAIWPTMTPTQKRHYIREMEEMENDHPEYNKLWQLRHDKRERHELRAKIEARDVSKGWISDYDVEHLKRLDERAMAEGWDEDIKETKRP